MAAGSPIGSLRFRVADLAAQRGFYERGLGLEPVRETDEGVVLAPGEGRFELELAHDPEAPSRPRPSIGLFHVAFLLPDRRSLAETLVHLDAEDVQLEGMADHGVSEAVYLSDPEGNGIELYRDRPREDWPTRGEHVAMGTDPLDLDDLLAQAGSASPPPAATDVGHVHLHVPTLDEAERFFGEGLGLRVRQRDFPGALFLARGDYHHHVGANVWARDRRAPPDAVGLESYSWHGDPETIGERFRELGVDVAEEGERSAVEDPAGLTLLAAPP